MKPAPTKAADTAEAATNVVGQIYDWFLGCTENDCAEASVFSNVTFEWSVNGIFSPNHSFWAHLQDHAFKNGIKPVCFKQPFLAFPFILI